MRITDNRKRGFVLATSQAGQAKGRLLLILNHNQLGILDYFFIDATHSLSRRSKGIPATSFLWAKFPILSDANPPPRQLAGSR